MNEDIYRFNYYNNILETNQYDLKNLNQIIKLISEDLSLKKHCEYLRQENDNNKRKEYKKQNLPLVIWQGIFSKRNNKSIEKSYNLCCIDIDDYSMNIENTKSNLKQNEHIFCMFKSPSGGLKVIVKTSDFLNDKEYKIVYSKVEEEFKKYNIEPDPNNKNISRTCFLSYDPEIYVNIKATPFKVDIHETTKKSQEIPFYSNNIKVKDIDYLLSFISADDYDTWIKVLAGLKTHSKQANLDLIGLAIKWSSTSEKFKCESDVITKWNSFSSDSESKCTLGTIFYLAKQNGWKPKPLPQISLPNSSKLIGEFSEELAKEVNDKNVLFYKTSESTVVKIETIKNEEEEKTIGFIDVTPSHFQTFIEYFIVPGQFIKNKETDEFEFKKKSINTQLAKTVLDSDHFKKKLKSIERIFPVPIPILLKGELTFPKRGYDERLKSWVPFEAPEIFEITFEEAKEHINNIFSEFCFKEELDKTNAIAGFITPFLRGLYQRTTCRTPVFFYEANRERAGKDYCAGITGVVYEGIASEEPAVSTDDSKNSAPSEEFRKKYTSSLRTGKRRLHFSNNRGYLKNANFEGAVTKEYWSDRLLGKNEDITLPNEIELSMSANVGLTYTPDFEHRIRKIRLFYAEEDPNKRLFSNPDLHGYIFNNRGLILSCLYALVKKWYDDGMPDGKTIFTSFPEWAKICGGILTSCGFGDPCLPNKDTFSLGGNSEDRDFKSFFEYMGENYPNIWIVKPDIKNYVEEAKKEKDIFTWFHSEDRGKQTSFALKFQKKVGRIFSDIQLVVDDENPRASRHRYMFKKEEKKKASLLQILKQIDSLDYVKALNYAGEFEINQLKLKGDIIEQPAGTLRLFK